MKIRIMGTRKECSVAAAYYKELSKQPNVISVDISSFYPNRPPSNLVRLYVDIIYKNIPTSSEVAKY